MYNLAVVGYGPAGVTAAIYAARKNLKVVLFGELPGGEVRNSGEIENWPGDGRTEGWKLADKFVNHLSLHKDNVSIMEKNIEKVAKEGDIFMCLADEETYESKAVIYATGRHPRKLGIPGEEEFKNKGVSYCATCDAPLFADKDVAVIGGGNVGVEAVIMLKKIARKIYLLQLSDKLTADEILVKALNGDSKLEIIYQAKATEVKGEAMVEKLKYEVEGKEEEIKVSGIFVSIGAIPNSDPVKDLVETDKHGAIVADRYGNTSVEGFFAAGDVTNSRDYQIIVSAGQGCSAALSAGQYLAGKEDKK